MTKEKLNQIIFTYKDLLPANSLRLLRRKLEKAPEESYETLLLVPMKNPLTITLFSVFLGTFGVDRFMLGDTGLGVCKLLFSVFTFGIWPLIDIFFVGNKAREQNLQTVLACL